MSTIDFSRRIAARALSADIEAYHGLGTVTGYVPNRSEAEPKNLKAAYDGMIANQKKEVEISKTLKAAYDAARQAEANFHDSVMAMKESVRGQFGPNSDEAQSVGYKKKSEYRRPRRRKMA